MQLIMKRHSLPYVFFLSIIVFISCSKQGSLEPVSVPETKTVYISFMQDTLPVTLSVSNARKESIGTVLATSVEGKLPDSILWKNNLIIRVTGDSARLYSHSEILASYTDSTGNTFSNDISDTTNTVRITKLEKIKDGIVEGSFTIRVSNSTKTKTLLLSNGKFYTLFFD